LQGFVQNLLYLQLDRTGIYASYVFHQIREPKAVSTLTHLAPRYNQRSKSVVSTFVCFKHNPTNVNDKLSTGCIGFFLEIQVSSFLWWIHSIQYNIVNCFALCFSFISMPTLLVDYSEWRNA
jgi:hypothetical protein